MLRATHRGSALAAMTGSPSDRASGAAYDAMMDRRIETETKFSGRLFDVAVLRWTDDQGRTIEREVVRHPGAVLIAAITEAKQVIMIRNRRPAVGEVLWEFPAGTAEPAEDPQRTAEREVEEETGYRAGRIEPIGAFYTSPGFTDEYMRVFVARDLTYHGQKLEQHEEIEVELMSIEQVRELARDGLLADGKSIAALHLLLEHLELHRDAGTYTARSDHTP